MLYYKTIRDKHDNSLINTLQDLNCTLQQGNNSEQKPTTQPSSHEKQNGSECFVKLEHTQFSTDNKKAMSLLIILLERKNEILKNLMKISTQRR